MKINIKLSDKEKDIIQTILGSAMFAIMIFIALFIFLTLSKIFIS